MNRATLGRLARFNIPAGSNVLGIGHAAADVRAELGAGSRFALTGPGARAATDLDGRAYDQIVLFLREDDADDLWTMLRTARSACTEVTRLLILLDGPFARRPARAALERVLDLQGFELIRSGASFYVCRAGHVRQSRGQLSCSVIVPCKNERGNIDALISRVPEMGAGTEIIFVDGNSTDGTVQAIEAYLGAGATRRVRLIHQAEGRGKGDAVRRGFAAARGDLLFILDADLTVAPETLPAFYAAIAEGRADFMTGARFGYPMEPAAMRPLNRLGNRFFARALSSIVGVRLADTLCGTKVLLREDYLRIAAGRDLFGPSDPFGDFDLLLGAARLNLKIMELPVRYRARAYGATKISRFRDGVELLRLAVTAAAKFRAG